MKNLLNDRAVLIGLLVVLALCAFGLGLNTAKLLGGGEVVEMAAASGPSSHTFLSAVVTDTNGTALDTRFFSTVGIQVEGIVTATVTFEGTIDGATWYGVYSTNLLDGSQNVALTADGLVAVPTAGLAMLRARVSGYSGGTITAKAIGINLPSWTGP